MKPLSRTLLLIIFFSVAMGFLESAVVIYLRKIYYPEGFHLPLKIIDPDVAVVELLREAATLIMLLTIAMLTGKSSIQRFAFFLLCFGIWDIFYYIFLKIFLNWPSSMLEGDVLFLIPVPWIGPVLAPCILSLSMIFVAMVLLKKEADFLPAGVGWKNISLMISGSCVVILSFIISFKDYVLVDAAKTFIGKSNVENYNWWMFLIGELLILTPFITIGKKSHYVKVWVVKLLKR